MANLFSRHAHDVFETGFYSEDFDFEVRIQLGQAPYGGADVGETGSVFGGSDHPSNSSP